MFALIIPLFGFQLGKENNQECGNMTSLQLLFHWIIPLFYFKLTNNENMIIYGIGFTDEKDTLGKKTHENRPKNALRNKIVWYEPVKKYGLKERRDSSQRKKDVLLV